MKRFLSICGIYAFCILAVSLCAGFLGGTLPDLLPGSIAGYKWLRSFLIFFDILPAGLISVSVTAYAVIFSGQEKKAVVRFSPIMFERFKMVALAALCSVGVIVAVQEAGVPLLSRSLLKKEQAPVLYREYIAAAEKYISDNSFTVALQYAVSAQNLYPRSEKALQLRELCELELGGYPAKVLSEQSFIPGAAVPLTGNNSSSYDLLLRSRLLYSQKSWLDAHYYANLALAIAEPGSSNADEAKMIASDAWNRIEETRRSEDPNSEHLFARKQAAYQKLMSGDILYAYYAFKELLADYEFDPDVARYYQIAAQELEKKYFFFDEIPISRIFEDTENMYFSVPRSNGGFFVVYIRGIATARSVGGLIQYARDLSVYSYMRNGTFEFSFYVPYAKIIAQAVSAFDIEFQKKLGVSGKNASVPYIMLESADRNENTAVRKPVFTVADENALNAALPERNCLVLPMPFHDLLLLKTVSQNPDNMLLPDLFKFAGNAQGYGFSREVYGQAVCFRACQPFYYLAFFILTAVLGWNYRVVRNRRFRFSWLFPIPLFTFVAYAVLKSLAYCSKLFNYGLISLFGLWSVPVIFGIAVVSVFAASVLFVSRYDA